MKQTLYKKDTKGNVRYLYIYTDKKGYLNRESGIVDTEKPILEAKLCKGKNIGKSNETSPVQQAISEANSIIKKKLDEGYFMTKDEAENGNVILPMLAKSYNDEKHKIDWSTAYIQPKLDGMRCLAHVSANGDVKLISRDGKIITTAQHIMDELSSIKEDIVLDGELYAHGLSFQENMKLKKHNPEKIKFHVYDLISNECFTDRSSKLINLVVDFTTVNIVHTIVLNSEDEIGFWHSDNIQNGYEGSIIRWGDDGYKVNGRSSNLLKYKDFLDIDAEIIDIVPAEQRTTWGVPVLRYNNKEFRSGTKMSFKDKEDLLTNKKDYIGKVANIRFFEYSDDGIPRFPVMIGIHEDR